MIRNAQMITSYDFSGGININSPAHLIADNECTAYISSFGGTKNCYWDGTGMKKRGGTLKQNDYQGLDLMTNGDCESTTHPVLTDDTAPSQAVENGTWARSAAQKQAGSYSYLLTKSSAADGGQAIAYLTDTKAVDDMHGLTAGRTYYLSLYGYTDAATAGNAVVKVSEYYAAAWHDHEAAMTGTGAWEALEVRVTLNDSAAGVKISVELDTSEVSGKLFYVDAIVFIDEAEDFINGIRFYRSTSPAKTTVMAARYADVTRLLYLDGTSWVEYTNGSALNASVDVHFDTWKDKLYVASGGDVVQVISYSGGWTRADITGLTYKPQYICQHKDRLWAAGGDMPEGYLECCGYDDDTDWAGGSGYAFNVGYKDGDPVRALVSLFDDLVVYKQDSIWVLRGDNAFNWFQHRDEKSVGVYASRSVADVTYGHIFLGIDNVYFFDGQKILPLGDNIKPWLDLVPIQYRDNAVACYHNGYYRLSFTSSTYNNLELVFNVNEFVRTGKTPWWLNTGRNVNGYVPYTGPGDDGSLYMADSDGGWFREIDTGSTDDGTSVEKSFLSKYYSMGNPNVEKMYDRLKADMSNEVGDWTFRLIAGLGNRESHDYTISTGGTSVLWGTAVWEAFDWTSSRRRTRYNWELAIPSRFDGYTLAFQVEHNGDNSNARFYGASISWAPKTF